MIEYKGYTGVVEFNPEMSVFAGHVVDLRDQIYFEGRSVEELETSMRRAVDQYLKVCKARGEEPDRPFSGNLHLRLGPELHRAAAAAAASEGRSLNAWIMNAVETALSRGVSVVRERESAPRRGGPEDPSPEPER